MTEQISRTAMARRPQKLWVGRVVTALLITAGSFTLSYPYAAQWTTQLSQSVAAERLTTTLTEAEPNELQAERDVAKNYNKLIASGAELSGFDYLNSAAFPQGAPLARLSIPAINLDQTVRHTLDESVLQTGLGHMEGSSLPVGGESTNAVIGGHRGLATAVGFTHLNELQIGDRIYISNLGETLVYETVSSEVLSPGDADMQPVRAGRDLITLVTCTPIGLNTDRIVLVAERVTPAPVMTEAEAPHPIGFPWWFLGAGAGLVFSAGYLLWPRLAKRVPSVHGHRAHPSEGAHSYQPRQQRLRLSPSRTRIKE